MSKAFDDFHRLPSAARRFILNDQEALKDLIKTNLSPERFEHSLSVAKTAAALAKKWGVNEQKAYLAGLLHDVTKYLSAEEQDAYLRYYDAEKMSYPLAVKHSFTAVYYLKEKLHFHDKAILNAIYNHTICKSKDRLSKILYIADKREPLRKLHDGLLELAFEDLNKAFVLLNDEVDRYLKQVGKI